jgi:hypothetical protein
VFQQFEAQTPSVMVIEVGRERRMPLAAPAHIAALAAKPAAASC